MMVRKFQPGLFVCFCLFPMCLSAQEKNDQNKPAQPAGSKAKAGTGLGIRQQELVGARLDALEERILKLARSVERKDPKRAGLLRVVVEEMRQMALADRVEATVAVLDRLDLESATQQQRQILGDLEILIGMIDEFVRGGPDSKAAEKKERLKRLLQRRADVAKLLDDETQQLRESDKVANPRPTLQRLNRNIEKLQNLISDQQDLIDENKRVRKQDLDLLPGVADKQTILKNKTSALAKQIEGQQPFGEKPDAESPDTENSDQPGDENPGHENPDGENPGDENPDGEKPDGEQPDGEQPDKPDGEKPEQPDGEKPGGGKPDGEKPEEKPDGEKPDGEKTPERLPDVPQAGSAPLRQATVHQQDAQRKLNQGRGRAAESDQQDSLKQLKSALAKLQQEHKRISNLPQETNKGLADRQDATAKNARQLAEQIAQDQLKDSASPQDQKQEGSQKPQKNPVKSAAKKMDQASSELAGNKPKEAGKKQREAIDDLKDGLEDIDKQLAELKKEMQDEKLASLLARYMEMLSRQKDATQATGIVQKKRQETGKLRRSELIMLRKLAVEETALAAMAKDALKEIVADGGNDGTNGVVQQVAARLQDDLTRVAARLGKQRSGMTTNLLQREIEGTLEELIAGLGDSKQENKQGNPKDGKTPPEGQQGSQEEEKPLLPEKAELKLLRAAQQRILRLTEAFQEGREDLDELGRNELQSLADRQEEIARLTLELAEQKQPQQKQPQQE